MLSMFGGGSSSSSSSSSSGKGAKGVPGVAHVASGSPHTHNTRHKKAEKLVCVTDDREALTTGGILGNPQEFSAKKPTSKRPGGKGKGRGGLSRTASPLDVLSLILNLVVSSGMLTHNAAIYPLSCTCKTLRRALHPFVKDVVMRRWDLLNDQLAVHFPRRLLLNKRKRGNVYETKTDDNGQLKYVEYLPMVATITLTTAQSTQAENDTEYFRVNDIVRLIRRFKKLRTLNGAYRIYPTDPLLPDEHDVRVRAKAAVIAVSVFGYQGGRRSNRAWDWQAYKTLVLGQFPNVEKLDLSRMDDYQYVSFPSIRRFVYCYPGLKMLRLLTVEVDGLQELFERLGELEDLKVTATQDMFRTLTSAIDENSGAISNAGEPGNPGPSTSVSINGNILPLHSSDSSDLSNPNDPSGSGNPSTPGNAGSNSSSGLARGPLHAFAASSVPLSAGPVKPNVSLKTLDLSGCNSSDEGNLNRLRPIFESFRNICSLDLSENGLGGSIPFFLAKLTTLEKLNLSMNKFGGVVPSELGNSLINLNYINLSCNSLEGGVPESFTNLKDLQYMSLHSNSLRGELPYFGNFSKVSTSSARLHRCALCTSKPSNLYLPNIYF